MVGIFGQTATQRGAFPGHPLASNDTFHKRQEWKNWKQILLCLHLYLFCELFHLRFSDSTRFTPAKLRLHFILSPQSGSSFYCLQKIKTVLQDRNPQVEQRKSHANRPCLYRSDWWGCRIFDIQLVFEFFGSKILNAFCHRYQHKHNLLLKCFFIGQQCLFGLHVGRLVL